MKINCTVRELIEILNIRFKETKTETIIDKDGIKIVADGKELTELKK